MSGQICGQVRPHAIRSEVPVPTHSRGFWGRDRLFSMSPTSRIRQLTALACLMASFVSGAAAQQPPPKFDVYVQRVMQTFTVPGLSVAIVKDGKVVLARGYGVRRMG